VSDACCATGEATSPSVSFDSLLSDPYASPVEAVCALGAGDARRYYRNMKRHRPYPSDLESTGPTLTAWRAERRGKGLDIGRLPEQDLRRIMDAILYVDRTGIPWRYLPHDFPPWEKVYGYFAAWQKEGVLDQLNGLLRRLVREAEGQVARAERMRAGRAEHQDLRQRARSRPGDRRRQENRRPQAPPRCRRLGMLLAVRVTAASVSDNAGGIHLHSQIAATSPRATKAWADTGYHTKAIDHGARPASMSKSSSATPESKASR